MGHAYDVLRGIDVSTTLSTGLPKSDINAVMFENYLRAEDGETRMRLDYNYKGTANNLRSFLGGTTAKYFRLYILPPTLKQRFSRMRENPITERGVERVIDNTRTNKTLDTRKQKFN